MADKRKAIQKIADNKQINSFKRHEESIVSQDAAKRPEGGYDWDKRSPRQYVNERGKEIDKAASKMGHDLTIDWLNVNSGKTVPTSPLNVLGAVRSTQRLSDENRAKANKVKKVKTYLGKP
jgi:hypothetical protein